MRCTAGLTVLAIFVSMAAAGQPPLAAVGKGKGAERVAQDKPAGKTTKDR
jgi:hypothetical protein